MNSIQISIEATGGQQEILISQLEELGATGFEQTDTHLIAYFEELRFNSYEVNGTISPYPHTISTLEERNWNEVWESNFQPVVVDDFCAIRAHFHEPVPGVEHEILITPKMSFGTGHHATTYMMIEGMRSLPLEGKAVFDFGTGTGILAILAEKLGAASIEAIDVDDWSIENTKENLQKNGCTRTQVRLGSLLPNMKFDIILANINRNAILNYIAGLEAILKEGGLILFSGLLTSDETAIVEAAESRGLKLLKRNERTNWISLLMSR